MKNYRLFSSLLSLLFTNLTIICNVTTSDFIFIFLNHIFAHCMSTIFSFGIKSLGQHSYIVHNMTDTLSHNPTQPTISQKDQKNKIKLCNDLGLCGVRGNTLSRNKSRT